MTPTEIRNVVEGLSIFLDDYNDIISSFCYIHLKDSLTQDLTVNYKFFMIGNKLHLNLYGFINSPHYKDEEIKYALCILLSILRFAHYNSTIISSRFLSLLCQEYSIYNSINSIFSFFLLGVIVILKRNNKNFIIEIPSIKIFSDYLYDSMHFKTKINKIYFYISITKDIIYSSESVRNKASELLDNITKCNVTRNFFYEAKEFLKFLIDINEQSFRIINNNDFKKLQEICYNFHKAYFYDYNIGSIDKRVFSEISF
jgi:hypothetical protein